MSSNTIIEARSAFYTKSAKLVPHQDSNNLTSEKSYTEFSDVELPMGLDDIEIDEKGTLKEIKLPKLPGSNNPYFNLRLRTTDDTNYPLIDEDVSKNANLFAAPSAKSLIMTPRGASIYAPDDFLYCENYGRLPLNRLITLRRFAHPQFDDIFNIATATEPDISRLLCYFDQDKNKLSDILSFSCGLNWRQIKSESESMSMAGGADQNGISGIMGKAMKFMDPKYGAEAIRGKNAVNLDPQHDQNRVYGPVDSITSVHIRDTGLNFEQEMSLTFDYKMQSINGVNQKASFIDLLSNILLMCTNDGKFWGGARYWVGPQPSKYMNDMKALSPKNFNSFVTDSSKMMHTFLGSMGGEKDAKSVLRQIANNAMNLALGKMLNVLGRPGIPVMNSMMTGTPIGPWHLTIGNPNNPILVAGDLLIDTAKISFGDELGFDDFPTTMSLTITLKHSKPRDRSGIESMFNAGKGRTYLKPDDITKKHTNSNRNEANDKNTARSWLEVLSTTQVSNKFGHYKPIDVERNRDAVWSFLKTNKD